LKYLTFMLADQCCGIELTSVRELLGYMPFTPTTGEHPAVVGWFDLRGRAVRVMDLRARFGLPLTRTDDTVMLVVEQLGLTMTLIVDSVIGLEKLPTFTELAPNQRVRVDPRCAVGVANVQDQTILLLDIARTIVIPPPLPKAA
jgi:chemotaxis signal transduction protein